MRRRATATSLPTGDYSTRNKGLLAGQFGTIFHDPASNQIDQSTLLDLTHAGRVRDFAVTSRVFYGDYTFRGVQLYPDELDVDTANGRWWGAEVKAVGTVQNNTRFLSARNIRRTSSRPRVRSRSIPSSPTRTTAGIQPIPASMSRMNTRSGPTCA